MTQLASSRSIPAVAWRARLPLVVVWSATAAYALLAAYFSLKRNDAFLSGFDVATLDQELWLLANGHEPVNTQDGRLFWGEQLSISMVLLVPLYWLGAGPATLFLEGQEVLESAERMGGRPDDHVRERLAAVHGEPVRGTRTRRR